MNPKGGETPKGAGKPGPRVKYLEEVKRQESYDRRIRVKPETEWSAGGTGEKLQDRPKLKMEANSAESNGPGEDRS